MQIKKICFLASLIFAFVVCAQAQAVEQASAQKMRIYALRLKPNQDLRTELEKFTKENKIGAGFIITAVGSLKETKIRLADKPEATGFEGKFEIVSLTGTLSAEGVHLHISASDETGKTIGGHLVEGCKIYTTAEIIIGVTDEIVFSREIDKETTFKELKIRKRGKKGKIGDR